MPPGKATLTKVFFNLSGFSFPVYEMVIAACLPPLASQGCGKRFKELMNLHQVLSLVPEAYLTG